MSDLTEESDVIATLLASIHEKLAIYAETVIGLTLDEVQRGLDVYVYPKDRQIIRDEVLNRLNRSNRFGEPR